MKKVENINEDNSTNPFDAFQKLIQLSVDLDWSRIVAMSRKVNMLLFEPFVNDSFSRDIQ